MGFDHHSALHHFFFTVLKVKQVSIYSCNKEMQSCAKGVVKWDMDKLSDVPDDLFEVVRENFEVILERNDMDDDDMDEYFVRDFKEIRVFNINVFHYDQYLEEFYVRITFMVDCSNTLEDLEFTINKKECESRLSDATRKIIEEWVLENEVKVDLALDMNALYYWLKKKKDKKNG